MVEFIVVTVISRKKKKRLAVRVILTASLASYRLAIKP